MKKQKKRIESTHNEWYSSVSLILILFFIAIIPLLIRVTMIKYPMNQFSWYPKEEIFYDSFSLFKSTMIILSGVFSVFLLITKYVKEKAFSFKDPIIILTFIMMTLTLLSHISSANPYVSHHGFLQRYESVWVWLSYFSMFLLVYIHSWTDKSKKYFIRAFVISNFLLCIIGIFQYFGINIIINEVTKPFITALNMKDIPYQANYIIEYKTIVQTLYHYNYVAFYISMSFPFVISLLLHEKGLRNKLIYGLLSILILLNLFGSTARSGLVSLVLIAPIFIYINRHILFRKKYTFSVLAITVILLFTGFEYFSHGFITMRLKSTLQYQPVQMALRDIQIKEDTVSLLFNEDQLDVTVLSHSNESWELAYTIDNEQVTPVGFDENQKLYFDHEKLSTLRVYLAKTEDNIFLTLEFESTTWQFDYQDNKLTYLNPFHKFDEIKHPDTIGFEGYETLGSGRGYIWSRSLPLITAKPLLGYGPDTFATVFPQSDYIGKMTAYGTNNMVVDKPHNQYLQMVINSGILYGFGFILYLIILIKRSFSTLKTTQFKANSTLESATLLAIISYYIAAFFNDSSVHVSPVFWVLLGLSLALFKPSKYESIKAK